MPLERAPASPALTNLDNSKLRATISQDRAALIAPASFMAGEEQASGSEINHIIAGIRNKYFRERPANLNRYRTAIKWPVNSIVSSFLARTSRYGDTWLK